jgi:RNA polymerase primary sigma factor
MRQLKITNTITNRDGITIERYFNEVAKEEMLTPQMEVELAKRIKQGDQVACDKLVRANLRFVISVAKQYQHTKMPLNDLINEGNIGLIKAAKMFDETKGFKFISYAVWWIRQSIMDALAKNGRLVRIPANKIGDLSQINTAAAAIEQKFEREPTHEELAEYLGVKVEDIKSASDASFRQSSLDAPFENEDGGNLYDIIQDPSAASADVLITNDESLKTELERLLSTLTVREMEVIKRFFGIGFDYTQSLEDIGEEMGLTRERIRQIKDGALRKLRSGSGIKLLKSYLG